ncbi:zinc finger MYM-type protein 1-like [Aphis craccivora]|uniref:Zinc finger MYM-type protein 1-like n=1 Tax=Aphis craccivora TaxID=307492 RepID=A0A6G0VM93_APHCR|nr:zinc finger MYM-type protein 1-like [Aphis craccivora]
MCNLNLGFAADDCNTMFGEHNSVSAKLKEQFPGIFLQKCICHSLHLVASAACKTLPRDCEDLVRDLYVFNYFKASCKRISEFKFVFICELEPHKMLRPPQTRWLSLGMTVSRIIDQWEALKKYFAKNHKDDRLKMAENIYHRLHDPSLFIDKTVIHSVHIRMSELYKDIIFSFIKKTPNPFIVDPKDETQYLPLNSIYLGASIQQHSNTLLNFIILFPRICNDTNQMQLIDDEWRKLNSYFDPEIINIHKNKNVDMFWLEIFLYEENGEKLFPNLAEFVLNVLSLPQSNCVCERLFSKVNLIKTKLKNKLMTKTINGLINTSECVKTITCVKFELKKCMLA